jgi:glycosyltransferase involved in cell wall biosynthesis
LEEKQENRRKIAGNPMELSIVICTYNRGYLIRKTIDSLIGQHMDKGLYEIVIVDNNSTDDTRKIAENYIETNPGTQIVYAFEENPGLSWARNKGIEASRGKYLSYIDDDAYAEPDYAENIVSAFKANPGYIAGGGKVIPDYGDHPEPAWLSPYLWGIVSKVDMGEKGKDFTRKYPTGCNMFFDRQFLKEIGGFNVAISYRSDEKFVFGNIRKRKKKIFYAPDVVVHHMIPESRLRPETLIKISKFIGKSEKERLRDSSKAGFTGKFAEYLFKLGAGLILAAGYLVTGRPSKGKWLLIVRYYILKGFVQPLEKLKSHSLED